jgi:hypothetical protein
MQMKANNGVLIIDDLGRQRIRPDELLNRWVVPLDRRIEFLSLAGGRKIEIPFEMLVVFASNLDPSDLMDPAFLRRIQTKIHIGAVTDDQFCEIFRRVARDHQIEAEQDLIRELITVIRGSLGLELRGCAALLARDPRTSSTATGCRQRDGIAPLSPSRWSPARVASGWPPPASGRHSAPGHRCLGSVRSTERT